jgi:hypothetical protein
MDITKYAMEAAKWMVAIVAVYNYGGLLYDAVLPRTARMHLYNPNWPPHAKFHNGQTMLLGVCLGTLALIILFGVQPLTLPMFLIAAAVAGAYFFAMVFATIFPGTAWIDPEFRDFVPKPLGLNPQQLVSYILCGLLLAAVVIACVWGR